MPPRTARRPSLGDFEIATVVVPAVDDRLVHRLPVDTIRLSGRNPRTNLTAVDELADSLREHGLLQPIVVRPITGGGYELIAGHRCLEAAISRRRSSDATAPSRGATAFIYSPCRRIDASRWTGWGNA